MNVQNFNDYLAHCQRIQMAFKQLPIFNSDAVLNAWDAGGIVRFDFTGICDGYSRSWINVGAHMSVAAVLGYQLAFRAQKVLCEEENTITDIVEALLIHDWNKRSEIQLLRRAKNVVDVIYRFDMRQNMRLRKWFSKRVLALIAVTGHGGVVTAEMRSLTLGEKIAFYSDLCTSGSTITTYARRIEDLQGRMRAGETYGRTEEYFQERYGVSHRKKHDELLLPIEAELTTLCGYSGPRGELPLALTPTEFHAPVCA